MTWSERDWADSDNESDADAGGARDGGDDDGRRGLSADEDVAGGGQRRLSPSSWNWTEKIAGKGAAAGRRRSRSPGGQEADGRAGPTGTVTRDGGGGGRTAG
ncbi:hypothetical protein CDD83_1394 [Cordyceps sp. RAO-2017]|nr:hypothetical protein CDD83_1394 [Cordyceps sp. RAO-2017]